MKKRVSKFIIASALLASSMALPVTLTACNTVTVDPKTDSARVIALIEALNDNSSEEEVVAAREAYEYLTDEAKTAVTQITLNLLRKQEGRFSDQKAAKAVEDKINALSATPTESEVNQIVGEYNRLTQNQQKYVSNEALTKLQLARNYVNDVKAANTVSQAIAGINENSTALEVFNVKEQYDSLSSNAKTMVNEETTSKLNNLVAQKEIVIANAQNVKNLINALANTSNENDVVAARNAYNSLTEEEKTLVDAEVLNKLVIQEERIVDQKAAQEVEAKISALSKTPTEEEVAACENAYNALTEAQKSYVSNSSLEALSEAREYIDILVSSKLIDEEYETLHITNLNPRSYEGRSKLVLIASEVVNKYKKMSDKAKATVKNQEALETIASYGYVVYGDGENDILIPEGTEKDKIANVSTIYNETYGNVYKADTHINPSQDGFRYINAAFALNIETNTLIAEDAIKLMFFMSNETTLWDGHGCNVGKIFNNGDAPLATVDLPSSGEWLPLTVDLTKGEGLTSIATRYAFQEYWGGAKEEGSIYFSRLVALTDELSQEDLIPTEIIELIDALPQANELVDHDEIVIATMNQFETVKNAYESLPDAEKALVSNVDKYEELKSIFDKYSVICDTYAKSDYDSAMTLNTIGESADASYGLSYDVTLREKIDVVNPAAGIKLAHAISNDDPNARAFVYVYNPGNDYSLGFGTDFWGAKFNSAVVCKGGEWTKIELTGAFSGAGYLTYGSWATPSATTGWKFTPVYLAK